MSFPPMLQEWRSSYLTMPMILSRLASLLSIRFSIARLITGTSLYLESKPGQLYGYRVDGPDDPLAGHRFDRHKVLLDPYGKSVCVGQNYGRAAACKPGDNAATSMKSVVADLSAFDWEGDRPLKRPFRRTVIYEMHVAGFTRHLSPALLQQNGVRILESSKRFHIFRNWVLPRSNYCLSSSSMLRTRSQGSAITGAIALYPFLLLIGLQYRQRPAHLPGRISNHGEGATPCRYRGHSRRCVQPYR